MRHTVPYEFEGGGVMDDTVVIGTGQDGPVVGVSALIHGNEPYGGLVLDDFFEKIRVQDIELNKGKVLAILRGNRLAANDGVRFVKHDLNRVVNGVPIQEQEDCYEQGRGAEIKRLVDEAEPSDWLDLHSFSAPNGLPYAFSGRGGYYKRGQGLGIQNMAINMANANKKADGGALIWRGMADYVNDNGGNGFTFEAGYHEDPQCYINSYQALINFLVSLDMIEPKRVEVNDEGKTLLIDNNGLIKIGGEESSHVHIEEKHVFKGGFEYEGPHPQSFQRYRAGEIIGYDIEGLIRTPVLAKYDGYIIMPKDPNICIKGKEVFYYGKDMSQVQ